jgi:hypothetical protein
LAQLSPVQTFADAGEMTQAFDASRMRSRKLELISIRGISATMAMRNGKL